MKIICSMLLMLGFSALAQTTFTTNLAVNGSTLLAAPDGQSTNTTIVTTPIVLTETVAGQIAWESATSAASNGRSNVIWTCLFSVRREGPWLSPRYVTNAPAGTATSNELQMVSIPAQARFMVITNAASQQTNAVTATIVVGQHWRLPR